MSDQLETLLGAEGDSFGAGFSGGVAFVYDPDGLFEKRVNPDTLTWQRVQSAHWNTAPHDPVGPAREGNAQPVRLRQQVIEAQSRGPFPMVSPLVGCMKGRLLLALNGRLHSRHVGEDLHAQRGAETFHPQQTGRARLSPIMTGSAPPRRSANLARLHGLRLPPGVR